MRKLKFLLIMLSSLFLTTTLLELHVNAYATYKNVPPALIGKYWKFKASSNTTIKYFWGTRTSYVVKFGNQKPATSKINHALKYHTDYILMGSSPTRKNDYRWWYIRPYHHFKKLQIGYTVKIKCKTPSGLPAKYAKTLADRIPKTGSKISSSSSQNKGARENTTFPRRLQVFL